ncbi:hypothetical protein ACI8AC_02220 [Geodermatophilus sp. SYSU D00758]
MWVHDVLAFRASAAVVRAGSEGGASLFWVTGIHRRAPTSDERRWVHHLGGGMVLATVLLEGGGSVDVAVRREHEPALVGGIRLDEARTSAPAGGG